MSTSLTVDNEMRNNGLQKSLHLPLSESFDANRHAVVIARRSNPEHVSHKTLMAMGPALRAHQKIASAIDMVIFGVFMSDTKIFLVVTDRRNGLVPADTYLKRVGHIQAYLDARKAVVQEGGEQNSQTLQKAEAELGLDKNGIAHLVDGLASTKSQAFLYCDPNDNEARPLQVPAKSELEMVDAARSTEVHEIVKHRRPLIRILTPLGETILIPVNEAQKDPPPPGAKIKLAKPKIAKSKQFFAQAALARTRKEA